MKNTVMPTDFQRRARTALGRFTLMQGLITVAAFSVLGALFLAHVNPSPQAICAANMHQLGLAMMQYAQDNDQSFPPQFYQGPQGWAGRIYPYVKSVLPYKCPKDTTAVSGSAVPVSYGMNSNLIGHLSQLNAPASTVLLFEVSGAQVEVDKTDEGSGNWKHAPASKIISPCGQGLPSGQESYPSGQWGGGALVTYATGDLAHRGKLTQDARSFPRHGSGSDFLGADGHVTYLLPGQVSSGMDGVPGNPQDRRGAGQAAATDDLFLPDGTTPVRMTFSRK